MQRRNQRQRYWGVQPLVVTLGFCVALIGGPGIGAGQDGAMPDASDEDVLAFAKAHVEVNRIHTTAEGDLPPTITRIDRDSVPHKETRKRMVQAIEATGLTLDTYNDLMEAYQTNEDFRSKVALTTLDLH